MKNWKSKRLRRTLLVVALLPVGIYLFALTHYSGQCLVPRPTCLAHRMAGCSISGAYTLGSAANPLDGYCDMETDKGGWTLVANYLHRASPQSTAISHPLHDRLPLPAGSHLGDDESGTPSWGHADLAILGRIPFHETRFQCRSSAHPRTVDFSVSAPDCLDYFRTGKGSCVASPSQLGNLVKSSRALEGHNGYLPVSTQKGWKDQGDNAMVNYPFFTDWKYQWSVGTVNNRWECDDYENGGTQSTLHRVWIR